MMTLAVITAGAAAGATLSAFLVLNTLCKVMTVHASSPNRPSARP